MLEHLGRKSGRTRRVVLEVVAHHDEAVYVAAAWGARAQWLQNVKADPAVTFYLGSARYRTVAAVVSKDKALELMNEYAEAHPNVLDRLAEFMLDDPAETPEEQARQVATMVPMVRLPKRL